MPEKERANVKTTGSPKRKRGDAKGRGGRKKSKNAKAPEEPDDDEEEGVKVDVKRGGPDETEEVEV